MAGQHLNFTQPNDAWILHREEIETIQDGNCNVYVLIDTYSGFCFGQEVCVDLPGSAKIISLLKSANTKAGTWPKQILILKKDPFAETFQATCKGLQIQLNELTAKDLQPFVRSFKDAFRQLKKGRSQSAPFSKFEEEELEAFVPESYSPCPCASGKKFKFCCQKAFKDIVFAMSAAEVGNLNEALHFMKQAEEKVGRTAEIVCRYAICWSFFDRDKFLSLLNQALQISPNHPRANYVMGIEAVADEEYGKAVIFYQTAIDNYPPEDRYHLNEAYSNLGTAYCGLKKFKEAKEVWEKALVLLPSDQMVRRNLFEFIYENPSVPKELRKISPFIEKYLAR